MTRPMNYPKPDLSHLASRQIKIPNTRQALEMALLEWMGDVVRHTRQPPEGGIHAEAILMSTAQDSIDVLMQAPTGMAVGGSGGTQRVRLRSLRGHAGVLALAPGASRPRDARGQ